MEEIEEIECPIEQMIVERDEEVYTFISSLDKAICLVDDLVDHATPPVHALQVMVFMKRAMKIASKRPGLYEMVEKTMSELLNAQIHDLSFVPHQKSAQEELQIWMKKANRLTLSFNCLCFLDYKFDTPENRSWILETQTKGLILNDCDDILSGRFEDFHQTRRNYVALSLFDQSIYYNWRDNKAKLIEAAQKLQNTITFSEPMCSELKPVYESLRV